MLDLFCEKHRIGKAVVQDMLNARLGITNYEHEKKKKQNKSISTVNNTQKKKTSIMHTYTTHPPICERLKGMMIRPRRQQRQ